LRRLFDALHLRDFGKDVDEEAGFVEEFEGTAGVALGEHLGEFVAHALAAHAAGFSGQGTNRRLGGGLDCEAEAGGEANRAEHSQMVLFEAAFGEADSADNARVEVGETVNEVEDGCPN